MNYSSENVPIKRGYIVLRKWYLRIKENDIYLIKECFYATAQLGAGNIMTFLVFKWKTVKYRQIES